MSLTIKDFEEEINCLCNLYLADKMKEAKCQKDRVIESFKEALKEKEEEIINEVIKLSDKTEERALGGADNINNHIIRNGRKV